MSLIDRYYGHLRRLDGRTAGHAGTVDWLLSADPDVRKSGRTVLMALTFVRRALLSPGSWVKVWDHHDPDRMGKRLMVETIRGLFPGNALEISESAIMSHHGWPRGPSNAKASPVALRRILIEDVRTATRAALALGADLEELDEVLREALVECVMEA